MGRADDEDDDWGGAAGGEGEDALADDGDEGEGRGEDDGGAEGDLAPGVQQLASDEWLLVVAKAAGLLVHSAGADAGPALLDLLEPGLHAVHRLDRETSGVVLLARGPEAAAAVGRSFAEGKAEKRYLALVRGVAHDKGVIRRPLTDDGRRYEALTRYRRLAVFEGGVRCTLVLARPATGRLHQVRRHLAGIGHPVLGDRRYGDPQANRRAHELLGLDRTFLHAAALTLPHPRDGQKRTFSAGLPPELVDVLFIFDASDKLM